MYCCSVSLDRESGHKLAVVKFRVRSAGAAVLSEAQGVVSRINFLLAIELVACFFKASRREIHLLKDSSV